jgi:hypothetical protein
MDGFSQFYCYFFIKSKGQENAALLLLLRARFYVYAYNESTNRNGREESNRLE